MSFLDAVGARWVRLASPALIGVVAVAGFATTAVLLGSGAWYVGLGIAGLVGAFGLFHKRPLASIGIWLVLAPLTAVTDSSAVRQVFWLVHRVIPIAVLIVLGASTAVGLRRGRKVELGWPEFLASGYLVATVLSLLYTGVDIALSATHIYDRIFIPICLYLIVRIVGPGERSLRLLVPILVFVLLLETVVGLTQWTAPQILPSGWLNNVGIRTTGTLREVNLYGATVLTCGLLILHMTVADRWSRAARLALSAAAGVGIVMAVYTFSRAVWLAVLFSVAAALLYSPRWVRKLVAVFIGIVLVAAMSGLFRSQLEFAQARLSSDQSEESALSRVPVMLASLRMYAARPIVGFGYENFDRYDYAFQSRIGDLYTPDKDHASHNVFLTIMAEQGTVGIVLFLGPVAYWAVRTIRARRRIPWRGVVSGRLLATLWVAMIAQIIVHNFSRLQTSFGFGLWWLVLGVIGSSLSQMEEDHDQPPSSEPPTGRSESDSRQSDIWQTAPNASIG